jgi:hypothetical protein
MNYQTLCSGLPYPALALGVLKGGVQVFYDTDYSGPDGEVRNSVRADSTNEKQQLEVQKDGLY